MEKAGIMTDDKRYLTLEQLCARLQVSKHHIYRMIHRREIPFIPMGRVRRFDPVAIDKWMAARSVPAKSA